MNATNEATARAIVAALGSGWALAPQDAHDGSGERWRVSYGEPLREVLSIRMGSCAKDATRIEVGIIWPRDPITHQAYTPGTYRRNGDAEPTTSITVAANKAPAKIADDIVRRLLPDGLKAWNEQEARRLAEGTQEATRQANIDRICAATTAHRTTNGSGGIYVQGSIYDVQVSDTSVSLKLTGLSIDAAIAIIQIAQRGK